MPEKQKSAEWFVNQKTKCVIITPDGKISINWSSSDFEIDRKAELCAARIVRMANSHDELVAAAAELLRLIDVLDEKDTVRSHRLYSLDEFNRLRAALRATRNK